MKDAGLPERPRGKAKWIAIVACAVAIAAPFAYVGLRHRAGEGQLAAKPIPELPADPSRWVNGAPVTLAAHDRVLLVEAWHPA